MKDWPKSGEGEGKKELWTPERKLDVAGMIVDELHSQAVMDKGRVEPSRLIKDLERLNALLNMPDIFLDANADMYPELEELETGEFGVEPVERPFNQFSTDNPQSDRNQIEAEEHRDDENDDD